MPYQQEWVAVPTPFLTDGENPSNAKPYDGSSQLILRCRISCDTTEEYNALRAVNFQIKAAKNLEDLPTEIANLTKQPNPPYQPFGTPQSFFYKDFSIDVSEIARSMLSHDLPLQTAGQFYVEDEDLATTGQINLTGRFYKAARHIQPCTMNNVTLHVTPSVLVQSVSTGLLALQSFTGTGQVTSVFTVINSVHDSSSGGAVDFMKYRLTAQSNARWLNRMRSNNYAASKDQLLKKVISQRPKDECSLYGLNSEAIIGEKNYVVLVTFEGFKSDAFIDCQTFFELKDLTQYVEEPNGYIKDAGTIFQIAVGLKTLSFQNPNVLAHLMNNELGKYYVRLHHVVTGLQMSEERVFTIEPEHDGNENLINPTGYEDVTLADSGFPNGSTAWAFAAGGGGTFGWAISSNMLRSVSSGETNMIVYSVDTDLQKNTIYEATLLLNTVPNTNPNNIVTIGTYASGAFQDTLFYIPQDPDYQDNYSAAEFTLKIYFTPKVDGKFALKKVSGYVTHSIDTVTLKSNRKPTPMPRVEAFPNLRVFWLNRLGGMDWYDFKDEYQEEISVKRTKTETALDKLYDPRMNATNRNSYTGGRHNLPNIGLSETQVPYRWENAKGTMSNQPNPYGESGYHSQTGFNQKFAPPHAQNRVSYTSEVTRTIKLTSGLLPSFLIRDLEDLVTSNAVYIQKWHNDPDVTGSYGHNYLEAVHVKDSTFSIVDEARKIVRLDIQLEVSKRLKTQHGG